MSTLRYSGLARIRVTYVNAFPRGAYRCFITVNPECAPRVSEALSGARIFVGEPACLCRAVDSPEAFDEAAHAALSFALDEGWPVESYAATNVEGSGWHIARTGAKRWPKSAEEKAS